MKDTIKDLVQFLKYNKKYWLLPLLIVFLILGFIISLGPTAAPFIYTIF